VVEIEAKNEINLPTQWTLPAQSFRKMGVAVGKDITENVRAGTVPGGGGQKRNAPSTIERKRKQGKPPLPLCDTGKRFYDGKFDIKAVPGFVRISLLDDGKDGAKDVMVRLVKRGYKPIMRISPAAEFDVMNIFERDIKAMTDTQAKRGKH